MRLSRSSTDIFYLPILRQLPLVSSTNEALLYDYVSFSQ
jgi:hypothetical protein